MLSFRSDIKVEPIAIHASDEEICRSAWVSSGNDNKGTVTYNKQFGLIRSLMRQKHGSPFEEGYFSFHIEAPRAVRDEHVRHRIGSYSSTSLRYRIKDHVVYMPPPERPLQKVEGFKQMTPQYEPYPLDKYFRYQKHLAHVYKAVYDKLQEMEADGFTETEAVRWITEDGLYVAYRARFNPRSLMAFLSLRTHNPDANHVSYPMWEIEQVARQIEAYFAVALPMTHSAFVEYGREAP